MSEPPKIVMKRVRPSDVVSSPLQPRKRFVQARVVAMALSIYEHGIQQPPKCREIGYGKLELIFGERRWRGAVLCEEGIDETHPKKDIWFDVIIASGMTDLQVLQVQLVENLERDELSPIEEANAYKRMQGMGIAIRDIATQCGGRVKKDRVLRHLRLLDIPAQWQAKIDSGSCPVWIAEEAMKAPKDQLEIALQLATKAGSRDTAHRLIKQKWVRPKEEADFWQKQKIKSEIKKLGYSESRSIFPYDVTILGKLGPAEKFAIAKETPEASELVDDTAPRKWEEYAKTYGTPLFAVIDGNLKTRILAKKPLITAAASSYHSGEPCGDCNGRGKINRDGKEPEVCETCGGSCWSRDPSLELNPFPDDSTEGRKVQRAAAKTRKTTEEAKSDKRGQLAVKMISELEIAVRKAPAGGKWFIKGVMMLIDAGLLGLTDKESPGHLLLSATNKVANTNELPLSKWEDFETQAGMESFCVCALALYWLDQWEGDDLSEETTWLKIASDYEVEIEKGLENNAGTEHEIK